MSWQSAKRERYVERLVFELHVGVDFGRIIVLAHVFVQRLVWRELSVQVLNLSFGINQQLLLSPLPD